MKKILIFLLVITTISCNDKIDRKLLDICEEIIENPESIKNLEKNFPDYYNKQYLYIYMKNSGYVYSLSNYILNLFQKKNFPLKIKGDTVDSYYYMEMYYDKINPKIRDKIKLYRIDIWENEDDGFHIIFIMDSSKYYIFKIGELHEAKM
jgi:hypothetical protein